MSAPGLSFGANNVTHPHTHTLRTPTISRQYMKVCSMVVTNVILRKNGKIILDYTSGQYMKDLSMAVTNVIIK